MEAGSRDTCSPLPAAAALILAALNPTYFSRLTSGGGAVLLIASAVLVVLGWLWMRRLGRLDFDGRDDPRKVDRSS